MTQFRIDVWPLGVPSAQRLDFGATSVTEGRVYFLRGRELILTQVESLCRELLSDPVTEEFTIYPLPLTIGISPIINGQSSMVNRQLLLRDACYPGWVARVDGLETPIRCADILFRAIDLPPNVKQVEFSYEPRAVQLGLLVSAFGIAIWLVLMAVMLMRRRV